MAVNDFLLFQYLGSDGLFYDEFEHFSYQLLDSLSSRNYYLEIIIGDKDSNKFNLIDTNFKKVNDNKYYIDQKVRIIHSETGNIIFSGKIKKISGNHGATGRQVQITAFAYIHEYSNVNVDFNPDVSITDFRPTASGPSPTPSEAINLIAKAYRAGGSLGSSESSPNIVVLPTNINPGNPTEKCSRNFHGTGMSALQAIDTIAMSMSVDAFQTGRGNIFTIEVINNDSSDLTKNAESIHAHLRPRFYYPNNPKKEGLTFVYGEDFGDGTEDIGVYRLPILPGSKTPQSSFELVNEIRIIGANIATAFDAKTQNPTKFSQIQVIKRNIESIETYGVKSRTIYDPTLTTEDEANRRAEIEKNLSDKPTIRYEIRTLGYPIYRISQDSPFNVLHSGEMVHVINSIYGIDDDFEVGEIRYNSDDDTSILELIKPGSGVAGIQTLDRQLKNIHKMINLLASGQSLQDSVISSVSNTAADALSKASDANKNSPSNSSGPTGGRPNQPTTSGPQNPDNPGGTRSGDLQPPKPDQGSSGSGTGLIKVLMNWDENNGTVNSGEPARYSYMDIEDYLVGVVIAEIGPHTNTDGAVEAQAIAARTYAIRRRDYDPRHGDAAVCLTQHCQAWYAPSSYSETAISGNKAAVSNTRGKIMLSDGKPIEAAYFAKCNGEITRNSESALLTNINTHSCAEAGWYYNKNLRSRACSGHTPSKETWCGYSGHGVGMCQTGAIDLASQGFGHEDILKRYYSEFEFNILSDSSNSNNGEEKQPITPLPGTPPEDVVPPDAPWPGSEDTADIDDPVYPPQRNFSLFRPVDRTYNGYDVVITNHFGDSPEYYAKYGMRGHNGIDFTISGYGAAFYGAPVYAADNGRVSYVSPDGSPSVSAGYFIEITHAWKGKTRYLHLSEITVDQGQIVERGQIIGYTGYLGDVWPSGIAGTHLHFDLSIEGEPYYNGFGGRINPEPYLTDRR